VGVIIGFVPGVLDRKSVLGRIDEDRGALGGKIVGMNVPVAEENQSLVVGANSGEEVFEPANKSGDLDAVAVDTG